MRRKLEGGTSPSVKGCRKQNYIKRQEKDTRIFYNSTEQTFIFDIAEKILLEEDLI